LLDENPVLGEIAEIGFASSQGYLYFRGPSGLNKSISDVILGRFVLFLSMGEGL